MPRNPRADQIGTGGRIKSESPGRCARNAHDDDAGLLIKLTDEVEQQRPAGFRERDVSQFINDHTIHLGQLANNFASVSFRLFPYQGIDEIDSIVEACLLTLIDERRAQSNGD